MNNPMIANYFKIFVRLFFKQTVFTLINIVGLSVGLACCMIIALFVKHELSFDRNFANSDLLYRAADLVVDPAGVVNESAATFFPVAPLIQANFPEVAEIARVKPRRSLISIGNELFHENEFKLVDPAFFRMFDFVWLAGDPGTALLNATDVVLAHSFAQKYFGKQDPLGQSLLLSDGITLRVTGVVEDLPANTHLSGSTFASMALRDLLEPAATRTREWFDEAYYTYVLLQPDVNVTALRNELAIFGKANIPAAGNTTFTLKLDAVTDIHLKPSIGDWKLAGNKTTLAVFTAVGLGILLVACANFINLSTAKSAQRFGEIGLRLTLGARRAQLIAQFLGESVLFVLLAFVLALAMVELLLPGIQALLGIQLAFNSLTDPLSLLALLSAGLVLGLVAGWYPALLMSRFQPAAALKRNTAAGVKGLALKNMLVIMQFSIAIGMIVAAIVIYSQMQFASELDAGYARDQVVVVKTNVIGSLDRINLLKERLLQAPGIQAATVAESTPDRAGRFTFVNTEADDTRRRMAYFTVDFDYFQLYEIKLLAGRLLSAQTSADLVRTVSGDTAAVKGSFVLNESGARELGWTPEEAVGQLVENNNAWFRVVGVVGDTIENAVQSTRPAIYAVPESLKPGALLSLKLDGNDVNATLAVIDRTWQEVNPDEPIVRTFLDDNIKANYRQERQLMHLAFVFAAIAICLSCMGLFGLASFSAERRTKEIGVRKVMGGSVWSIVLLLTNDFSKLVLLSNFIAWPVAYFAMERWLQNFAYRIELTPLIFIGSGLIALCIAWVTVGGTAAKAASQKPVLALRYE
jgi:putative ABC transport system permease protein